MLVVTAKTETGSRESAMRVCWFGTLNGGNFEYELVDPDGNNFVPSGYVQKIYADGLRRIWLISNDGPKRIQNAELPFHHLFYPDEKNNFIRQ